jgi:3-hydroxyisobutyrate dehydrogenase
MERQRIGFIGLGDQGGPMAEMLLADGHEVHVWARRVEVVQVFAGRGARCHAAPAELAAAVDLVGLCVTADADVLEVAEQGGLLAALAPGSVLAIHSTVSPAVCSRLAEQAAPRAVAVIDAPVSGSGTAARERRLLMMTGGDAHAAERIKQAYSGFCRPILHMGVLGSALHAKFINNTLMGANLELARYALAAGERFGIGREQLRDALLAGVARSYAMEAILRLEEPQRARHIGSIMVKDLQLAQRTAVEAGVPLELLGGLAQAAREHLHRCGVGAAQAERGA